MAKGIDLSKGVPINKENREILYLKEVIVSLQQMLSVIILKFLDGEVEIPFSLFESLPPHGVSITTDVDNENGIFHIKIEENKVEPLIEEESDGDTVSEGI